MQPNDRRLGLTRKEVGYILIAVGVFVAYISPSGVVGNIYDNGPLCSYPQPLPACTIGKWLVIAWALIGAAGVAAIVAGVYLALQGTKSN
jgi:hypothetical protein